MNLLVGKWCDLLLWYLVICKVLLVLLPMGSRSTGHLGGCRKGVGCGLNRNKSGQVYIYRIAKSRTSERRVADDGRCRGDEEMELLRFVIDRRRWMMLVMKLELSLLGE